MCCVLENYGVDDIIAAADKVACRCGDVCAREGAARLRRMLDESAADHDEGGWQLRPSEAGGDVD